MNIEMNKSTVRARVRVCVCVCVCERARVFMSVCEISCVRKCVCVCGWGKRGQRSVYVCVCARARALLHVTKSMMSRWVRGENYRVTPEVSGSRYQRLIIDLVTTLPSRDTRLCTSWSTLPESVASPVARYTWTVHDRYLWSRNLSIDLVVKGPSHF